MDTEDLYKALLVADTAVKMAWGRYQAALGSPEEAEWEAAHTKAVMTHLAIFERLAAQG